MSFRTELKAVQDNRRGVAYAIAERVVPDEPVGAAPDASMTLDQIRTLYAKSLAVVLLLTETVEDCDLLIAVLRAGHSEKAKQEAFERAY